MLETLGLDAYEAREKADLFRRYNLKMLEATVANYEDTEFRIAICSVRRHAECGHRAGSGTSGLEHTWLAWHIDGKAPENEVIEAKSYEG